MVDRLIDAVLYRYTQQGLDNNSNPTPHITTGTIVLGGLLRFLLVMTVSWFVVEYFGLWDYKIAVWVAITAIAVYPAYRQFEHFHSRITEMQEGTLCGSCRHFDSSGQLCRILDEHVSSSVIPCEGLSWEPHSADY